LAVHSQNGPRRLPQDLDAAQVRTDGGPGFLKRAAVLNDPDVATRGQRLLDVRLGVDPATQRLLGSADLSLDAGRVFDLVGALKSLKGLGVAERCAELDALLNQSLSVVGWCGGCHVATCNTTDQ
jgi:hypothetical protein